MFYSFCRYDKNLRARIFDLELQAFMNNFSVTLSDFTRATRQFVSIVRFSRDQHLRSERIYLVSCTAHKNEVFARCVFREQDVQGNKRFW